MPPKTANNPQRRRRIEQLVRNELPGCHAEFVAAAPRGGLAFRIRAASGPYRSGVIKLLGHHTRFPVNRAWLMNQMKVHGGPAAP